MQREAEAAAAARARAALLGLSDPQHAGAALAVIGAVRHEADAAYGLALAVRAVRVEHTAIPGSVVAAPVASINGSPAVAIYVHPDDWRPLTLGVGGRPVTVYGIPVEYDC